MLSKSDPKTILVVYEHEQVDAVEAYIKDSAPNAEVIALDYWVEQELKKRGVDVRPLTDYIPSWRNFNQHLTITQDIARRWSTYPETAFFTYAGLSLGEMIRPIIDHYLQSVLAYLFFFEEVVRKHPEVKKLVVPHSLQKVSATAGPFARFQTQLIANTAEFFAQQRGLELKLLGTSYTEPTVLFPTQSIGRTLVLGLYNFFIGLLVPRRSIRILVSDYWRNIQPIIEKMSDTELIIVDRKEFRNIPWKILFKLRIRFMHPLDAINSRMRLLARSKQNEFRAAWPAAKKMLKESKMFSYHDFDWWPLVEPVFDYIIATYAERYIADIESVKSMLEREHINRTLVRASISAQHHFFILGELPHHLGIPSVEIQHGIGVGILDPDSSLGHLHADYIASYGPLVQRAFVHNGYAPERIIKTGSPRFDRYFTERDSLTPTMRDQKLAALGLDPKKPVVFVVMPEASNQLEFAAFTFSGYECRDFILALREIKTARPDLQFILKFRAASQREIYESYIREVLPKEGVVLEDSDPFSLLLLSDFVYSCFSTLLCECIMGRKPVVLFPLKEGDTYFYEAFKDGVITVPLLKENSPMPVKEVLEVTDRLIHDKDFYEQSVQKGQEYLEENFTFKGDASKRVADFLRNAKLPQRRN
jgi:hypothetical protein